MSTVTEHHDAEILSRLVQAEDGDLSPEFAEYVLGLEFGTADRTRMRQLSQKAREGELVSAEQAELDSYERVGHFLSILRSKARRSLGRVPQDS